MHARVTFKNESSGEYTFYEVKLTSTAPAPLGRLSLQCPVRNQTSTTVNISNPLATPVTLKPSVNCKQVRDPQTKEEQRCFYVPGQLCSSIGVCQHAQRQNLR